MAGRGIRKVHRIELDSARESVLIDTAGREVKIADASDASAEISIALQDNLGDLKFFALKKNGRIGDGQGFSKFYIKNEAQSNKWVKLIISDGPNDFYVENQDQGTIDSVGSIDDPVEIIDDDIIAAIQDVELSVDETKAMLQDDENQRNGLTTLAGATITVVENASTTLVSGAANTSGIILRHASIGGYANGGVQGRILIGGAEFLTTQGNSNSGMMLAAIRDIFIPAGDALLFDSDASSISINGAYEVL